MRARDLQAVRWNIISEPLAAGSGKRLMAASRGRPLRMGNWAVPRWERLPFPNRIRTSCTSAWVKPSCEATSCKATAYTNPPTPGRRGIKAVSKNRKRSRGFGSIRPTQTLCMPRYLDTHTARTRSAAFSSRLMAARAGRRFCIVMSTPAQLIWLLTQTTRMFFTRPCGMFIERPGFLMMADPAAGCSNRRTAARVGKRSRRIRACRRELSARLGLAFRRRIQIAFMRWSRRQMEVCFARMTPERRGRLSARIGALCSERSISLACTPILSSWTRYMSWTWHF